MSTTGSPAVTTIVCSAPLLGRMLKRQFTEQIATLKRVVEETAVAA